MFYSTLFVNFNLTFLIFPKILIPFRMKLSTFLNFLEYEKRFSPHTIKAYRNDLDQFFTYLSEVYDITSVEKIKHTHIRSWVVDLMQKQTATRSVNRKLSTLKTYFKFLIRRKLIVQNPMLKIVAPKMGKRLPVFVDKNHLELLFDQIGFPADYPGKRNRTILEVLYQTGMRRAELIGLIIKDIDFSQHHIKVMGKGGKERLIPFGGALKLSLQEYLDQRNREFTSDYNSPLFLTNKGKKLYPKLVYNLVKRYLAKITTIEQKSPHVLRHSFATHLSDNGADLNAIKALLGHASLSATQIYTHNSIERLRKVYQKAHPKA